MWKKEYTEKDVLYIQQLIEMNNMTSLDAPITGKEGDVGGTVQDYVQDDVSMPLEDVANEKYIKKLLGEIMDKCLRPREIAVLKERYGLDTDTYHTLEEVGQMHGITRERVRQIEREALRKIRKALAKRDLNTLNDLIGGQL